MYALALFEKVQCPADIAAERDVSAAGPDAQSAAASQPRAPVRRAGHVRAAAVAGATVWGRLNVRRHDAAAAGPLRHLVLRGSKGERQRHNPILCN